MSTKLLKDPIYGYIEVDSLLLHKVIELACLLHDVGHAPFSHTGELFFLADSSTPPSIYATPKSLVGDAVFVADVDFYYNNGQSAAPHEVMSCIVALNTFCECFKDQSERNFFCRCITGFSYRDVTDEKTSVLNCLISLLNSPIIDVDRLDYIIRDAKTTGFQSVSIDYIRLLDGIRVIDNGGGLKRLGYHKSALSIIENVIYAHDAERKWIQNHPTILYEHFLIQHAMRSIDKIFSLSDTGERFFSYKALTEEGVTFAGKGKISLLADEDIIFLMKNVLSDALIKEYFARNLRRRPLWKSEAEYRALFDKELGDKKLDDLEMAFREVQKYLIDRFSIPIINEEVLRNIEEEIDKIHASRETMREKDYANLISGASRIKKWVTCLKNIANENAIPFDFAVISTNTFKSGFMKEDLKKIVISFPALHKEPPIDQVSTILSADKARDSFFYLFYRTGDKGVNVSEISKALSIEVFK